MGINILIRVNHKLGDFVQSEVGKFTSELWVASYPVLFNLIGLAFMPRVEDQGVVILDTQVRTCGSALFSNNKLQSGAVACKQVIPHPPLPNSVGCLSILFSSASFLPFLNRLSLRRLDRCFSIWAKGKLCVLFPCPNHRP